MSDNKGIRVKRNYNDSIFNYIFKNEESFKHLYKTIKGISLEGKLEYFDTGKVLSTEEFKNDVSFLTDDNKLIVLVEHQSTINHNMPLRHAIYYFKAIEQYLHHTNQMNKLYRRKPVSIPKAELIVLYNGLDKLDTSVYTLEANYGEPCEYINVKSIVYDINFDRLTKEQISIGGDLIGYSFLIDKTRKYENNNTTLESLGKKIYFIFFFFRQG